MAKYLENNVDIRNYTQKCNEKKIFERQVKECQLKLTMLVIEHNLPMDHLSKLMTSAAPDSEILKKIDCTRTKTTCLLKNFQEGSEKTIAAALKDNYFSIIVDETTDVSETKCLAILYIYILQ
ncbi:hypothetical protein ABEB36_008541 [Hypothenemus hampei]|uniref:DUF4371 domain-containing protein n=1 Tax=Hypothenemus hampei TaxID=57062 RepID=A0ABD1EMC5_HYPHA